MTENDFILMIKRQPIGAIILADAWDGSQKKRAKILRDAGYRKDHNEPGTWVRVSVTRYLSDYSAGRHSYRDMKESVRRQIGYKNITEIKPSDISIIAGIYIIPAMAEKIMTEIGFIYDADARIWKRKIADI